VCVKHNIALQQRWFKALTMPVPVIHESRPFAKLTMRLRPRIELRNNDNETPYPAASRGLRMG
jgi:hypothetical protein